MVRGNTYTFNVTVPCSELGPLYISSSDVGVGQGALSSGLQIYACDGGAISFTPNELTPNTIYYQSYFESWAGGPILVTPEISEAKVVLPGVSLFVMLLVATFCMLI